MTSAAKTTKTRRWGKTPPATKPKHPGAQDMGRIGGSRNTPAQVAARARNAKLAGRPRRVCTLCGEPVHGGHKDTKLNARCTGRTWEWQTPREKRAAEET